MKKLKRIIIRLLFTSSLSSIFIGMAQSNGVINEINIHEEAVCAYIEVALNLPIVYDKHYPIGSGDEIHVQFKPLSTNDKDKKPFVPEVIQPPPNKIAHLYEVEVEENANNEVLLLNLYFARIVNFEVNQGKDYRSIEIVISGSEITKCTK